MDAAGPSPLEASAREPGLLAQVALLWAELRGLAHDHVQLLALELREARARFALMLGLALAAAALLSTAWLGLAAAAVVWMVQLGVSPVGALLAAVAANVAAGTGCVLLLRRTGRVLPFAATLRSMLDR